MMTSREKPPVEADLVRQIESLTPLVWPPAETKELSGWMMATDRGISRRANSVLPNRWDGNSDIDQAVDRVEKHYRSRGLPPCFKITEASMPAELDGCLAERGYRTEGATEVLAAQPKELAGNNGVQYQIENLSQPTGHWANGAGLGDGTESSLAKLQIIRQIKEPKTYLLAMDQSESVGAAVVSLAKGWACISGLHVSAQWRGKGIGRSLIVASAVWSMENQAESIFLQVEVDNPRARSLYERLGWRYIYRYHYRTAA